MSDSTFTVRIQVDIYEHKPEGVTVHYFGKDLLFPGNGKHEDVVLFEKNWIEFENKLLESKLAMDPGKGPKSDG